MTGPGTQPPNLNELAAKYVNPMASQQRKRHDAWNALRDSRPEQAVEALAALALDIAQFGLGPFDVRPMNDD